MNASIADAILTSTQATQHGHTCDLNHNQVEWSGSNWTKMRLKVGCVGVHQTHTLTRALSKAHVQKSVCAAGSLAA